MKTATPHVPLCPPCEQPPLGGPHDHPHVCVEHERHAAERRDPRPPVLLKRCPASFMALSTGSCACSRRSTAHRSAMAYFALPEVSPWDKEDIRERPTMRFNLEDRRPQRMVFTHGRGQRRRCSGTPRAQATG